jgi:hypothetical protein
VVEIRNGTSRTANGGGGIRSEFSGNVFACLVLSEESDEDSRKLAGLELITKSVEVDVLEITRKLLSTKETNPHL